MAKLPKGKDKEKGFDPKNNDFDWEDDRWEPLIIEDEIRRDEKESEIGATLEDDYSEESGLH